MKSFTVSDPTLVRSQEALVQKRDAYMKLALAIALYSSAFVLGSLISGGVTGTFNTPAIVMHSIGIVVAGGVFYYHRKEREGEMERFKLEESERTRVQWGTLITKTESIFSRK